MAGAGEVVTLASVVVAAVVEVTVGAGGVGVGGRLGVELCWKLWAGLEKVEPSKLI